MRFLELMNKDQLQLVISCPFNDYDFVKAAWENGADAVKIHLNVDHHASGNHFGSVAEELSFIEKVLENSPVPVGVVLGGSPDSVREDFINVLKHKFDYLSVYLHDATSEVLEQNKITKMFAASNTYSIDEIKMFEVLGTEILEVSIMNPEDYGKPLNLRDLVNYKQVNQAVSIPTLLPTQKKVTVQDLQSIKDVGFNGIMVGAVVTSKDFNQYVQVIKDFRSAIDELK